MARNISKLIKLQGTILGLTFVKSKRYKDHVRSARGTFTPITINETLRKASSC